MHTWQDNSGTAWVSAGTHNEFIVMTGAGTQYSLTPVDLATGRKDAEVNTGYGFGYYGTGNWGQPRPVTSASIPAECTVWQLDNFGQNLVGFHSDDRRIFEWDLTVTNGPEVITNPTFDTDSNWTKGVGWTIANGSANFEQYSPSFNPNNTDSFNTFHEEIEFVNPLTGALLSSHSFTTGDPVIYRVPAGSTPVAGLTPGTTYYIKFGFTQGNNEVQLETSPGAGAIDFTALTNIQFTPNGSVVSVTNNTIFHTNQAMVNDLPVIYEAASGATVPIGGLTFGTTYYIVNRQANNTFQLSATLGGSAIDFTSLPSGGSAGQNILRQNHILGGYHQLEYAAASLGTLSNPLNGLSTSTPNKTHEVKIDFNSTYVPTPSVKIEIKVAGASTPIVYTTVIDEFLQIGTNTFRFNSTSNLGNIEIIPQNSSDGPFSVDNISVKNVTVASVVATAPINNKGIVVTEERFLMCLGAGGNSRKIQWSDKEDLSTWTAAANNEAGDIELATSGQCMQGVRTRGGTIILTDTDCHLATYVGPPYVYSTNRIATNCGTVSRASAVAVDQGCFWFGQENFHYFDGNSVQTLKCDVHDYVFGDFNTAQQSKVWGVSIGSESEIWWFYPSGASLEIDRYVAYDYRDGHWLIGNLSRTSGTSRGVFAYPFMAGGYELGTQEINVTVVSDGGNKFSFNTYSGSAPGITLIKGNTYVFKQDNALNQNHPLRFSQVPNGTHAGGSEYTTGVTYTGVPGVTADAATTIVVTDTTPTLYYYCSNHPNMGGAAYVASPQNNVYNHEVGINFNNNSVFCETGPIEIGNGDQITKVTEVLPDEVTQGDVDLSFKTKIYPNGTEQTYGPFNPSNPTSIRFSGRQFKMRVDGDSATNWKVGTMRVEAKSGGKR